MEDERCRECGELEDDCRCVPPVIEGQEELFPPAEPAGERGPGAYGEPS